MGRYRRLFLVIAGLCTFLLVCLVAPLEVSAAEEVTIAGTVYEDDWDDDGNPTVVVIESADGEEYVVSASGKGKELLKLDGREVQATGIVSESSEGWKTITIMAYEVIE